MRKTLAGIGWLTLIALLAACTREPDVSSNDMLAVVPADTPYVFVTSRHFPAAPWAGPTCGTSTVFAPVSHSRRTRIAIS